MFKSLMADMVGIDVQPVGTIELAKRYGFTGVDLRLDKHEAVVRETGADVLNNQIADAGLRTGYCSLLPGKISCEKPMWQAGLKRLPALAALAEALGYTRTYAVVLPFDDKLDYQAFFELHLKRLNEAAPVLADHGLSLALEYVSPLTRRAGHRHPFIYNLQGMRELCRASGHKNVGVMVDSFHWHCAGETVTDLESLGADEVFIVHVNDLIAGRPVNEQLVTERALPCETGVIDLAGFMKAMKRIGFTGPVTAEPTHPKWKQTDSTQAIEALTASMDRLMGLA